MESQPHNPGERKLSDDEKVLLDIYDETDLMFRQIGSDNAYEKVPDRHMNMTVPPKYLDDLNKILEAQIMDPADSVDIVIVGRNPYSNRSSPVSAERGALWINFRSGHRVNSFALWINPALPRPVNGTRDLFTVDDSHLAKGDTYDAHGAMEVENYEQSSQPIGQFEQTALSEVVSYLIEALRPNNHRSAS